MAGTGSPLAMTEARLLAAVVDLCRLHGLLVAHFRPGRTDHGWRTAVQGDGAGFPDLVVVGGGGVLCRELKTDRGCLTAQQRRWLEALRRGGVDAGTWRPADLRAGVVVAQLRGVAGRGAL